MGAGMSETAIDYAAFLESKAIRFTGEGVSASEMNSSLFPFQAHIVEWALRKGRACIFADCGLGKTIMSLEWAKHVPGRVLIIAPLAVTRQTTEEAVRFGYDPASFDITNYERIHQFDLDDYAGIVLDESSILKSYGGAFCRQIIESTADHRFKLALTATPAPNDHMELGTHAEFVGAMSRPEMLAMYFVNDGSTSQAWRLKGHARSEFWRWVSSWAVMLRRPSDIGFHQPGYELPRMTVDRHFVSSDYSRDGILIPGAVMADLRERRTMRRDSISERVARAVQIVESEPDEQWIVWCDLNAESEAVSRAISGAVEIRGSQSPEEKANRMMDFTHGKSMNLVTKPRIAGHGMNWQQCARMVFLGMSDSYEAFYQAVRRCWRFGQNRDVVVHVVVSEPERMVVDNVLRKERQHAAMQEGMIKEVHCVV